MGSKNKLRNEIWESTKNLQFETVLDLFSGSASVGYMYKCHGKTVISNDYMAMSYVFAKAMIENNTIILSTEDIDALLKQNDSNDNFVQKTFGNIYFSDEENNFIDNLRANIKNIKNPYKKSIAMTALIRACMKKRPRGIFTYTGDRYNDGRKDLKKSLERLFLEAIDAVNYSIFDNEKHNIALWENAMDLKFPTPDLVYIDPPYFTPKSDNEYVRRYHFVEGLARDWNNVEIQENTKTKKFRSYPTPFSSLNGAMQAFNELFNQYKNSILVVSYSSNSQPNKEEIVTMLSKYKAHVNVNLIDHTYSFGTTKNVKRNNVQEYIFVGY